MSPEQETWEDAKTRLETLEHAVVEAQAALDAAPDDAAARRKRDMVVSIRDVGVEALDAAQMKLEQALSPRSTDA